MNTFAWDHNAYYHRLLLRQVPLSCRRALEVGWGAGTFATKLAEHVGHVDALDSSPEMIEAAKRITPENVTCVLGDITREPLPVEGHDAIFSISALHHVPLKSALRRLATALRPGGVLAAIALPRVDLPREVPAEVVAVIGHQLLGAVFAAARRVGHGGWYEHESTHAAMPIALDAPFTTRQALQLAASVLPGVHVRRLVFWRYFLLWQKPSERGGGC